MNKVHVAVAGMAMLGMGQAFASMPVLEAVSTVQDGASRRVTVTYTLSGEPGIVTPYVETNRGDGVWVEIPDKNVKRFAGDVYRVIEPGSRQATWSPHKSWPDQYITGGNVRVGMKVWSTNTPPDYLVVDLRDGSKRYYPSADALPGEGGVTNDLYKTYCYAFRRIPAADVEWLMGSPTNEYGRTEAREKLHHVVLSKDFYMAVYQMTQFQYKYLMGANPSYYTNQTCWATRPVEQISLTLLRGGFPSAKATSVSLVGRLQALTGLDIDSPWETQWEFACRAGTATAQYLGEQTPTASAHQSAVNKVGRTYYNGGGELSGTATVKWKDRNATAEHGTAPVGSYAPNAWGLYDMIGNCWEFCLDNYQQDIWTGRPELQRDPMTLATGNCVRRGGSIYDTTFNRSGSRSSCNNLSAIELNGVRLCIQL